jgi:hypothetical protein
MTRYAGDGKVDPAGRQRRGRRSDGMCDNLARFWL